MKISELTIKDYYAGFAIIIASVLSFLGTLLPPLGVVDQSMLYLIAQFLVLAATLMGLGHTYNKIQNLVKNINRHGSTEPVKGSPQQ